MKKPTHLDPLLGPLTDDALTREYRVWQRLGGHRFSSDDMATAWVAYGAAPDARRVLDLGTGLGSVLLQLAWRMPAAPWSRWRPTVKGWRPRSSPSSCSVGMSPGMVSKRA